MTMPTDDLAAQMVREMLNRMHLSIRFSDADVAIMEECARRYIKKARLIEREANALLTDEVERLRKALASIVDDCEADYPPSHDAIKYTALDALKAAQEVKHGE